MQLELDPEVRGAMIQEIEADRDAGRLYVSARLTEDGAARWAALLLAAAAEWDDTWLGAQLLNGGHIRVEEISHRRGVPHRKRVPRYAHETLAEGEFNRFYLRALCAVVLALGGEQVEVYRARPSRSPRASSLALEGRLLDAGPLLADLRQSVGVDTALGLPPSPNSGLSARHPREDGEAAGRLVP